ncbi:uncharacterized protein LOC123514346 [Portunus trituberculatus]|uniref:uncharacterized protein LOC123514346 n=1 Tax=Portunus trituberculatus TaxID=210409 RepID=UPI001E1CEA24|nr:uncharacterized protein LOC123514346 [Portunus trituberculatus]XP_045128146.1 uncharacterized protein LOC123514346 [Portunus trituberculatus]
MGVTGSESRAAAVLLLALLMAPSIGGQRQESATRSLGATHSLRHVFGVEDQQYKTSQAPQTSRPSRAPPASTVQRDARRRGKSTAGEGVQHAKDFKDEQTPESTLPEVHSDPESRHRPHKVPRPEAPRVPELPEHLPPGLASRLNQFPRVAAGPDNSPPHAFFQPRIQVEAEEVSDAEWEQLLVEGWARDGVVPRLLPAPPPFLVNVNYGDHQCVHLGNTITPAHTRAAPNTLRFPGEKDRRYTVMLLDVDAPSPPRLHWLLINVPAKQPREGDESVEYEAPRPNLDTGQHRLVFLVYRQRTVLRSSDPKVPSARSCQSAGRDHIDLTRLASDLELEGPTAANYFLSEWDVTVEHTCTTSAAS